jgi:hypothetical protein
MNFEPRVLRRCLGEYDQSRSHFETMLEDSVEGCSSRVDYVALVDDEQKALCQAKSPSVMKKVEMGLRSISSTENSF